MNNNRVSKNEQKNEKYWQTEKNEFFFWVKTNAGLNSRQLCKGGRKSAGKRWKKGGKVLKCTTPNKSVFGETAFTRKKKFARKNRNLLLPTDFFRVNFRKSAGLLWRLEKTREQITREEKFLEK